MDDKNFISSGDLAKNKILNQMAKSILERAEKDTGRKYISSFVCYIFEQQVIRYDLLMFLHDSDFLDYLRESNIPVCESLLDNEAETGWFQLILEAEKNSKAAAGYCKEFLICFNKGISLEKTKELYEKSETVHEMKRWRNEYLSKTQEGEDNHTIEGYERLFQDIYQVTEYINSSCQKYDENNKKVGKYLEEQNSVIEQMKQRNCSASVQADKMSELYRETFQENMQLKKETISLRAEIEELKKKIRVAELVSSKRTKDFNELISRTQEYQKEIAELKDTIASLCANSAQSKQENEKALPKEKVCANLAQSKQEDEKALPKEKVCANLAQSDEVEVNNALDIEDAAKEKVQDSEMQFTKMLLQEENRIEYEEDMEMAGKRIGIFSELFMNYYRKKFQKKTDKEKENLIFAKMLQMEFEPEKVKIVRDILRQGADTEYIYEFLETNPSIEQLKLYKSFLGEDDAERREDMDENDLENQQREAEMALYAQYFSEGESDYE